MSVERDTAEWYVDAKRKLADPEWKGEQLCPRFMVEDAVAQFEDYMNGPHPFLDALSRSISASDEENDRAEDQKDDEHE